MGRTNAADTIISALRKDSGSARVADVSHAKESG